MILFHLDGDDIFLSHLRQRVLEEVFVHVGLELETQNDHIKAFEMHFVKSVYVSSLSHPADPEGSLP